MAMGKRTDLTDEKKQWKQEGISTAKITVRLDNHPAAVHHFGRNLLLRMLPLSKGGDIRKIFSP
jgi:hypothetical protein